MKETPRRLRQDVATHNCAHFIGKRKQKRKTPRQKRKQKRKPGIAYVGNICFYIDFVLFSYGFVTFLDCFLFGVCGPIRIGHKAGVVLYFEVRHRAFENQGASLCVSHCHWPNIGFRKVSYGPFLT